MAQVRRMARLLRKLRDPAMLDVAERAIWELGSSGKATCPICRYEGRFGIGGTSIRFNAICPECGSAERHRLLALAMQRGFVDFRGRDVLHFAPEEAVTALITAQSPTRYVTGDILPGRAQIELNIEALALADGSFDRIMCSHVMEHVDDARALRELHRVLSTGGQLLLMVPIIEGWDQTYEDAAVVNGRDRERHFGQDDHIRFYGRDFRDRVRAAGFRLEEFSASGADSVAYNLVFGERLFLAHK